MTTKTLDLDPCYACWRESYCTCLDRQFPCNHRIGHRTHQIGKALLLALVESAVVCLECSEIIWKKPNVFHMLCLLVFCFRNSTRSFRILNVPNSWFEAIRIPNIDRKSGYGHPYQWKYQQYKQHETGDRRYSCDLLERMFLFPKKDYKKGNVVNN